MNTISKVLFAIIFSTLICLSSIKASEERHEADRDSIESIGQSNDQYKPEALKFVNNEYLKNIKPIFQKKCFDCHSDKGTMPFYYKVPGIKQLIDKDIQEAREELDMSMDFPFKSEGSFVQALEKIKEEIQEGDMPPLKYKIFHWDNWIQAEEKQLILKWADDSINFLEQK